MLYSKIRLLYYRNRLERKLRRRYGGEKAVTFTMNGRDVGFFSMFFQVIGALHFCRKYGHDLKVDFVGGPYYEEQAGENWWEYYFTRKSFHFSEDTIQRDRVLNEWEQKDFSYYGRALSPAVAHAYVDMVAIRDVVYDKFIDFKNKNMDGRQVVALHYRGTDKVSGKGKESDRVRYKDVFEYLEQENESCFFVATDEQAFLDQMQSVFIDRVISYNALRSNDCSSIHSGMVGASMHKAGEDALIDCLLLASCSRLVRTDSNLSYACRFFNPVQPHVTVGI